MFSFLKFKFISLYFYFFLNFGKTNSKIQGDKMRKIIAILMLMSIVSLSSFSQERRDKGVMMEYKNPYWEEIEKGIREFENKPKQKKLDFKMDFTGIDLPKSTSEFKQIWHNEPISQGSTGTCWSFAATSFFESEIFRITGKKIKLSEMFTVYWEYIEKARRFVQEKGNSTFAEGSQANALKHIFEKYGCVPATAYSGMKEGQKFHNHSKMFEEMNKYLQFVKQNCFWNEEVVLATIKSILNSYMGTPPTIFNFEGKEYTPQEFLKNVCKVNPNDYIDLMSLLQEGFWKNALYDVPDNWWRCDTYMNVPVEDFIEAIKNAVKSGYSVAIGGDVSESGYYSFKDVAMVPTYDIPSAYIDDYARQFRFSNGTTGDDHGIHIVGIKETPKDVWFLIKDSGSGARNGENKGYYFYHLDYVKLKMINCMMHKDAAKSLIEKFEKNKVNK